MDVRERHVTLRVALPGGLDRLRQIILYVSTQCSEAKHFGAVKLNKIIWKADFDAFAARGVPVTGGEYRKQADGPALRDMALVQHDMVQHHLIRAEHREGRDAAEDRIIALVDPDLSMFSKEELRFVEKSIAHYWTMTGSESIDESHGVAWQTRAVGESMPYEAALLSDKRPPAAQWERLKAMVAERGITSA